MSPIRSEVTDPPEVTAPPEVAAALRLIERHHTEPLTLDQVAGAVGYSPFHLSRRFKSTIGLAPMQWLATQRFQHARRLLLTTGLSVTDVCMAVGFSSLGTFTRRFTAEVGIGPREFRRLPEQLIDHPARSGHVPGMARDGGRLAGRIEFTADARALVGDNPAIYIGLFTGRAARGRPICGSYLRDTDQFCFRDIPAGDYWLLASAYRDGDAFGQLTAERPVTGGTGRRLTIGSGLVEGQRVLMSAPGEWATPITVALPALTAPGAARPLIPLPVAKHRGVGR